MKAELITEAASYCQQFGQDFKLLGVNETQPPYILGNYPRTELVFTCTPARRTSNKVDV